MRDVDAPRGARRAARTVVVGLGLAVAVCSASSVARADPPISSPEDAACREVARAKVFSVPDPLNLGLREIGRRIYMTCLQRQGRSGARRHHRRRR